MRYDHDPEAQKKQKELIEELSSSPVPGLKPDYITTAINEVFFITAPYSEDEFISADDPRKSKIVLQDEFGLTGAHTYKRGNVKVNMRKVIENGAETSLSMAGSAGHPFLMALIALFGVKKLLKADTIQLEPIDAMIISFLWGLDKEGKLNLDNATLHAKLNDWLTSKTKPQISLAEFNQHLGYLDKLRCIKLNSNGVISLIEEIVVEY